MLGSLLGGIGLFLLGMSLLTDGLQTAAGDSLRHALHRHTQGPWSSVATGTVVTVLAQSSTVTTMATIGFVGAGLLPLSQALGVIYGANLGTTLTGWVVATVGLKVKLSTFALPLVGLGALGKLFFHGRRAALCMALAGIGLLFVGIDVLQEGMAGLTERFDPSQLTRRDVWGRLLLVGLGLLMTVIMQSSSAAVATTLTAVHGGTLGLEEAAAVVIGQNVGTTMTALLGSLGAPIVARRAALAHLAFNLGTAVITFLCLPLFLALIVALMRSLDVHEPAVTLAAFHTGFSVLGVLIFVPLSPQLLRLLSRLVPERGEALTHRLSTASAKEPAIAVESARQTTLDVAERIFLVARDLLSEKQLADSERESNRLRGALQATRDHLQAVRTDASTPTVYREHVGVLHALDHLSRLLDATREDDHAESARELPEAEAVRSELALRFNDAIGWVQHASYGDVLPLEATSKMIADARKEQRHSVLERMARGDIDVRKGEAVLDAMVWLDRIGYHAWRAMVHLARADRELPLAKLSPLEPSDRSADVGV